MAADGADNTNRTASLLLFSAQPTPDPQVAPLSDVGQTDWPTLGDAKQPLKKRDRPEQPAGGASTSGGTAAPAPVSMLLLLLQYANSERRGQAFHVQTLI